MSPFRINIETQPILSLEVMKQNAQRNADQPLLDRGLPHKRKLAVCGGSPSLADHLDELKSWDGEIWSVNWTAEFLQSHGIESTMFTVDPQPFVVRARDALLASACDPTLFDQFAGRVRMFHMIETHEDGHPGGITSALRAPAIAFYLGYTNVSFFGCDSSFTEVSHVDRNESEDHQLIVRAGGDDYRTTPGLMVQSQNLAQLITTCSAAFHNQSAGLLKAMIENPETWEVVGVSAALKAHLEEVNGASGLYDKPYQPLKAA